MLAVPGADMKVYITRWALTRGILEAEAALATTKSQDVLVLANGMTFFTGEWFLKLDDAEDDFEDRKLSRLAQMKHKMELLRIRQPRVKKFVVKPMVSSGGRK